MKYNLFISDKPNKRLMIKYINPKTLRENTIYFGSKGENYIIHNDDKKKLNYIKRHSVREDFNNLSTAGAWSRWLLWGERTLQKSIRKMETLFNIKIIDNVLNEKHSAYRSMKLAKLGLAKKSDSSTSRLIDWKKEKWQNITSKLTDNKFYDCGTKGEIQKLLGLPSVCRPSIRVNNKTPKLASEYSNKQILEAIKIKNRGSRINWSNL